MHTPVQIFLASIEDPSNACLTFYIQLQFKYSDDFTELHVENDETNMTLQTFKYNIYRMQGTHFAIYEYEYDVRWNE